MTTLGRRLDALEQIAEQYPTRSEIGYMLMAKVFEVADRYRLTPPPADEQQSHSEQMIRAAIADAEGASDCQEYAERFWAGFTARARAYIQEH